MTHIVLSIVLMAASMLPPAGIEVSDTTARPLVIAHRGGALLGNENSISCLENGMRLGSDMVEIDVHMTSDGELVVCHDPTIDRTTDGKGAIAAMTLDSLRQFHILDSRTGMPTEEMIPTLGEVLALVATGRERGFDCGLLLEVKRKKGQYEGIEGRILQCLRDYDALSWTIIQSFNDSVIENVHALDPDIPVEKLIVCRLPFGLALDGGIVRYDLKKKYAYVSGINTKMVSKGMVKRCHEAGKTVRVWTVNDPKKAPKFKVDGIITNRPDLFVKK